MNKPTFLSDYDIELMVTAKHLKAGNKNQDEINREIQDMKELRDENKEFPIVKWKTNGVDVIINDPSLSVEENLKKNIRNSR